MQAKALLEHQSFTARLSNRIGAPIEKGLSLLPKGWTQTVQRATQASLQKALDVAISTLGSSRNGRARERFHKLAVGASGGIGGAFGLASLPIELPISTTIMLRSIAAIAREEGHDVTAVDVRLNCLQVFALGSHRPGDDAVNSGYWAVRAGLARALSEATAAIVERGVVEKSAPAVLRLIGALASRFGVVVSEQVAAKAVPIVGAAGGSMVNILFLDHFQNMARGHFIVRRLENRYGHEVVKHLYQSVAVPMGAVTTPSSS
jgi:hypothetical protein